jgi:hypothetical protein
VIAVDGHNITLIRANVMNLAPILTELELTEGKIGKYYGSHSHIYCVHVGYGSTCGCS